MFRKIDDDKLQEIILDSTSISEVLRKINLKPSGSNHTELTKYLKNSNFDTHTLVGRKIKRFDNTGIPNKKLSKHLSVNSTRNSAMIRRRLIAEGIKENKCELCGTSSWMGKDIVCELHHINGDRSDNRLENLIILCPNCHSQTTNFRGKNSKVDLQCIEVAKQNAESDMIFLLEQEKKREEGIYQNKSKNGEIIKSTFKEKTIRYCEVCGKKITGKGKRYCSNECYQKIVSINVPSKDELIDESFNHKSLESLSKKYKVCSNACKKWLLKYGIYDEVKSNFKQISYVIYQYDLNGNFIKEWKDGNEIFNKLGFNKSKIHNTCIGVQKTSNGYIWRYKKDV